MDHVEFAVIRLRERRSHVVDYELRIASLFTGRKLGGRDVEADEFMVSPSVMRQTFQVLCRVENPSPRPRAHVGNVEDPVRGNRGVQELSVTERAEEVVLELEPVGLLPVSAKHVLLFVGHDAGARGLEDTT